VAVDIVMNCRFAAKIKKLEPFLSISCYLKMFLRKKSFLSSIRILKVGLNFCIVYKGVKKIIFALNFN
jgi:hypothetical protein